MMTRTTRCTLAALPALLCCTNIVSARPCADPQYAMTGYAAGTSSRAVALGDLDADGDLDMAIVNSSTTSGITVQGTEGAHVLLNNGDGTFAPRQFYDAGTAPQSVELGDVDGDGDLDMVVAELGLFGNSWVNDGVRILLNDGAGGFGPSVLLPIGPGHDETRHAALGDLDHDGDLDIVVSVASAGDQHSEVAALLNDGSGSYGSPHYYDAGYGAFCIALADLDGDGHLDAVTANDQGHKTSTLYGDGAGGFGAPLNIPVSQYPKWITLADLDGDGAPDQAIASKNGVTIRLNGGGSAFHTVGLRPTSIAAGDVDDDGDLDLAVANSLGDSVSLLRNDGTGMFTNLGQTPTGNAAYGAAIGDIDGNGLGDVVVANMYAATATVMLGDCADSCTGDLDGSGGVGFADLDMMLGAWGACAACPADMTFDGAVGFSDLSMLLTAWGTCP